MTTFISSCHTVWHRTEVPLHQTKYTCTEELQGKEPHAAKYRIFSLVIICEFLPVRIIRIVPESSPTLRWQEDNVMSKSVTHNSIPAWKYIQQPKLPTCIEQIASGTQRYNNWAHVRYLSQTAYLYTYTGSNKHELCYTKKQCIYWSIMKQKPYVPLPVLGKSQGIAQHHCSFPRSTHFPLRYCIHSCYCVFFHHQQSGSL